MKKHLLRWFVSCLIIGTVISRALNVHGQSQILYKPCDFEANVILGCNCSCVCPTNMDMTNMPIGAFFSQYGVTTVFGTAVLASTNGNQYIPPHWGLLVPLEYPNDNIEFEGWTTNVHSQALAGGGTVTLSTPGNFNNPIIGLLGFQ